MEVLGITCSCCSESVECELYQGIGNDINSPSCDKCLKEDLEVTRADFGEEAYQQELNSLQYFNVYDAPYKYQIEGVSIHDVIADRADNRRKES